MYIARRDFFLSWEACRVYTFLTIAVSDRIFSPAPGRNQYYCRACESGILQFSSGARAVSCAAARTAGLGAPQPDVTRAAVGRARAAAQSPSGGAEPPAAAAPRGRRGWDSDSHRIECGARRSSGCPGSEAFAAAGRLGVRRQQQLSL